MTIKFSKIIMLLSFFIGIPAFAQMSCNPDGSRCTGTYPVSSAGAVTPTTSTPPPASSSPTNMDAKSYRERECHDLLGAALKARGENKAKASAEYAQNLALCPPEITRQETQPGGLVITTNPYATCEKGLAASKKAADDKTESNFTNAMVALPSYCPRQ